MIKSDTTITTEPRPGAGGRSISAADFESVMRTLEAEGRYSSDEAETLRFWFFTARERGWSLGRLSQAAGVSTTVLSRLFRGIYPADAARIMVTLRRARENFAESADNPEFIETSLARRMFAAFDKTRALRNVSMMFGNMGIGKTECIGEYARLNNSGRTVVVRFPAGSTFAYFVSHVARACGVAVRAGSAFEQRAKVLSVLGAGQRLLIVDELHQAFLTTRADTAVRCCEFLREVSDVARCGMALVGTEALSRHIFEGPHREALRQLVDRGTVQMSLPSQATKSDVAKFLAAYGLEVPGGDEPEAQAVLADILKSSGLRKLTLHLRDGSAYAARRGERNSWDHFLAAFEAIQALSK